MKIRTWAVTFTLLFGSLVVIEFLCALLAYDTIGEVTSGIYILGVVLLNLMIAALAFRYRVAAVVGAVVVALLVIPYQVVLGHRLLRVQEEAGRIVAYAYEQRIHGGAFPSDLSGYKFHDAQMKTYVQDYQILGDEFALRYRVGTESTSHWYSSVDGWGYYPD